MPISGLDGCTESHWTDVQEILLEAIEDAGFEGRLVSNADEAGVIQKAIIQNLYENPIIVCDVSGKNPNVMFELGMRLAFDKPVIIVKDDKTTYSFDTAPIEHLEYPRDLRFSRIVAFKERLAEKIKKTHGRATADPDFTTFLRHFGEFKVAKIEKKEVPGQELILDELTNLRQSIQGLQIRISDVTSVSATTDRKHQIDRCLRGVPLSDVEAAAAAIRAVPGVNESLIKNFGERHCHIRVSFSEEGGDKAKTRAMVQSLFPQRPSRISEDNHTSAKRKNSSVASKT
jgi:hypothetical protein